MEAPGHVPSVPSPKSGTVTQTPYFINRTVTNCESALVIVIDK